MDGTYQIKLDEVPDSAWCLCGHSRAAHGSNGKVCCACGPKVCKGFERDLKKEERLVPRK